MNVDLKDIIIITAVQRNDALNRVAELEAAVIYLNRKVEVLEKKSKTRNSGKVKK